jgi:hypothetical protein
VISCSWVSKRSGFRLRGRKLPLRISGKYSWASGSGVLTVRDLADLSLLSLLVGVVKEDNGVLGQAEEIVVENQWVSSKRRQQGPNVEGKRVEGESV